MITPLTTALVAMASADAAAWQLIVEGQASGSKTYLDPASIVIAGIYRAASVKTVHEPDRGGGYDIRVDSYDCLNRTKTPVAVSAYGADGKLITAIKFRPEEQMAERPQQGSVGDIVLDVICR